MGEKSSSNGKASNSGFSPSLPFIDVYRCVSEVPLKPDILLLWKTVNWRRHQISVAAWGDLRSSGLSEKTSGHMVISGTSRAVCATWGWQ